jgi:hypothetical protein
MASGIYNRFFYGLGVARHSWPLAGGMKVALVGPTYTFNKDYNVWSSVSSTQITGTGYTAGGRSLLTCTCTEDDTNDWAKLDANDRTWTTGTFSAAGAVIYKVTGSHLVCFFSFGTTKTCNAGNFTLQWNSNGLMTLAQA